MSETATTAGATPPVPRPPLEAPRPPAVPEKPTLEGLEAKWSLRWEEAGTYTFDRTAERGRVFAIDTPPPTVSGELHLGHVFSYTHTDTVARYRRMRGYEVFYPMGFDDNGLPTERRVQNYYGVLCDPGLRKDPSFAPPDKPVKPPVSISRPDFIELCGRLVAEDEKAFEELWRTLGLSVDWNQTYATIDTGARRASQRGFLHLLAQGHVYSTEAPTQWDVDFQTAVSQAEMEDRELSGAYHRLRFGRLDADGAVEIETTRPELLAACVALVAHPDDARYQPLFGTEVVTPLFKVRVPVLAHELADPEKGSGVAMICTFGDATDVTWWRELSLPTRTIVGRNGRLHPVAWGDAGWESTDTGAAAEAYGEIVGKNVAQARTRIVELLAAVGAMVGDPTPITHPVKFYEKGDRPLEIVSSRQWYVRTLPLRERLLERGRQLHWHPSYMIHRYEAWVEGLNSDWNISRQRYFGVPFPVWYRLTDAGEVDHDHPLVAHEGRLPVDPSSDVPDGYTEGQRGAPGGFIGDPDVMDTWATSSLTPQIAGHWADDPDLFDRVFPMDLRPQSHEIIRTWLFSTVVRSELEHGSLPWADAAISGWVLAPSGKKMSKSRGNVVTPLPLLETHGSDGVRYWAASGRPGVDTAVDEGQMKVGRRLAIKILNASRFALSRIAGGELPGPESIVAPIDLAMLGDLARVVDEATSAFEAYDYARALERTEAFFWSFCDDYLELVKGRAYEDAAEEGPASARAALGLALSVLLRLLAPFVPFVSEEAWSWWHAGSIHRSPWPGTDEFPTAGRSTAAPSDDDTGDTVLSVVAGVLGAVRRTKTTAKRSMRTPVARLTVVDDPARLALLAQAEGDLRDAGGIVDLVMMAGATGVTVELGEDDSERRT
ncbi:MAG TPA: valine--tRNA ligase [Acidimicrobiales bacterium]|nr:valine--tRNA ligase [Acidimicrobiales bacterium]